MIKFKENEINFFLSWSFKTSISGQFRMWIFGSIWASPLYIISDCTHYICMQYINRHGKLRSWVKCYGAMELAYSNYTHRSKSLNLGSFSLSVYNAPMFTLQGLQGALMLMLICLRDAPMDQHWIGAFCCCLNWVVWSLTSRWLQYCSHTNVWSFPFNKWETLSSERNSTQCHHHTENIFSISFFLLRYIHTNY